MHGRGSVGHRRFYGQRVAEKQRLAWATIEFDVKDIMCPCRHMTHPMHAAVPQLLYTAHGAVLRIAPLFLKIAMVCMPWNRFMILNI